MPAHAGIQHRVENVDRQVDPDIGYRRERDDGLDHQDVAGIDGIDQELADSRQGENVLDDDEAADQPTDLQAETVISVNIDGRNACRKRMWPVDMPFALASAM